MTTKEHLSKHDREIAAIRKLILLGMKLVNLNQQEGLKLRKELRELAAAQKRTEAALKAYLESRTATNGHTKRKVDLQ